MKLLPKQEKFLCLPIFEEQEQENQKGDSVSNEEESSSSEEKKEKFDDSSREPEDALEEEDEGNIFLENDDAEKSIKEKEDSKNIFLTKEDQEILKALMRESLLIKILPPIQTERSEIVHLHFDTQVDLRKALPSEKNFARYKKYEKNIFRRPDWYGGNCNFPKEVEFLAKEGWKEGTERILELVKSINIDHLLGKKSTRSRKRGRQGSIYHIHEARGGRLERAWTRSVTINQNKKITKVEIWLQIVANAYENAEDMFWAPASALALAETLQNKRYAVQIMSCSAQSNAFVANRKSLLTTTCLKKFSNKATIEELSFSALAGNFRYFWFRAFCSVNERLAYGLGYPFDIQDKMLPKVPHRCRRIIVPRLRSLNQAKTWLSENLTKIAKEID